MDDSMEGLEAKAAAERLWPAPTLSNTRQRLAFDAGAKWQRDRFVELVIRAWDEGYDVGDGP